MSDIQHLSHIQLQYNPSGFHRDVPGYPRYSYTGDASMGQHHLTISSVSLSAAGEYQCQVGPTLSNPPIWAAANLTVVCKYTALLEKIGQCLICYWRQRVIMIFLYYD